MNPDLQKLLDELARGCYESYKAIDLDAMEERCGLSRVDAAPSHIAVEVHNDDGDDEDGDDEDDEDE